MFPYADNPMDFWSGYYTSRAGAKKQVRDSQATLHAATSIFAKKVIQQETTDDDVKTMVEETDKMLDAMGVYQHHDAISGTAK
jgi:lysosomal alpha-mannosidase